MTDTTTVTMYFDATCPFAWVTSRWLKEVGTVRDIEVEWAPMSLAVLNEDNEDISDGYREHLLAAWGPARVAAAVYTEHPEALDAYYTAIGTRIHNEKRGGSGLHGHDGLISEALAEAGLPASLIDVAHRGPDEGLLRAAAAGVPREGAGTRRQRRRDPRPPPRRPRVLRPRPHPRAAG